LAGSTPLEQWRAQGRWPVSYDRFWAELKQRRGKQNGTRAMIDILLLGRAYGHGLVRQAIEKALEMGCCDVSAVCLLLQVAQAEPRRSAEPVEIGTLSSYDRPQPTTANYDQLLTTWPDSGVIQ
jgi:hypothetical protein